MISSTDIEKMHECFQTIRERLVHKTNRKAIQKLCIQRNVTTQKDYILLQSEMTHLPDNPIFSGTTWFDYLNPNTEKIDIQVFVQTLNEANKGLPSDYIDWYQQVNYPSLQNIRDGYFGEEQTNFIQIVETFAPLERRRR
jgi:hypothetical protein